MLYMGEMLVPSHRLGTVSYCSWYKYFTGSNRTPGIPAPPSKPGSRNEKHLSLTGCRTGQARYGGTDRGCARSRLSHVFGRECPVPFISTDRRPPVYRLTLADPAGNSGCNHPTGPYDPPLPRKEGFEAERGRTRAPRLPGARNRLSGWIQNGIRPLLHHIISGGNSHHLPGDLSII